MLDSNPPTLSASCCSSQEARQVAGKGLGGGAKAEQGVNTEALGRLMNGGASGVQFERISIAINFFQSFGLLGLIKLNWPVR